MLKCSLLKVRYHKLETRVKAVIICSMLLASPLLTITHQKFSICQGQNYYPWCQMRDWNGSTFIRKSKYSDATSYIVLLLQGLAMYFTNKLIVNMKGN